MTTEERKIEGNLGQYGRDVSTTNVDPSMAENVETSGWFRRRNVVTIFMFFGYMICIILRSNMSIAIVDMTNPRKVYLQEHAFLEEPEFHWTSAECGYILSVFSVGQMFFSIPAGWLGSRCGGVKVMGIATLVSSLLTILTPALLFRNDYDVYIMIVSRGIIGTLQVVILVNVAEVTARWIPAEERARVVGFSAAGANCGSAVCYLLSGYLAQFWRWPFIFYVTGFIALLWAVLWLIFVRETPAEDPWISEQELKFLSEKIKPRDNNKTTPWMKILTSKAVFALCVYRFGNGLDALFLRILIPLYIGDVLQLDVGTTGLLTSLVIVPSVISMYLTGYLKDFLQNNGIMTRHFATLSLMTIGTLSSTAMLFLIAFLTDHFIIAVILMFIPFFSGMINILINVNALELSSEFASTISGISSTYYTISQLLGPIYVGLKVTDHQPCQWQMVLVLFGLIELLGLFIFLFWGSTETEDFRAPIRDDETK